MNAMTPTQKEHFVRVMKVVVYIEKHLDETLELHSLAKEAYFSQYHFHRIFKAYTGYPVKGYVRRLRLERAAMALRFGKRDVTEVALDAGYDTPSAFSKAFRQQMGTTPSAFRRTCSWEDEISSNIENLNKESIVEPEFQTLEDVDVLFIRRTGNYFESAPAAWSALYRYLGDNNITKQQTRLFGIGHDDPSITAEDNLRYDACAWVEGGREAGGEAARKVLPGGLHAVFTYKGPYDKIGDMYDKIYGVWYPTSGKRLADRPCVTEFVDRDNPDVPKDEQVTKIYLPLKG